MDEKLRILLCEDDENLGMLLREYLQAKGYAAELYPDGEAGYKAFLKNKYDLCVFDVMMPKKDGFTLAQEVRAANAEIPVIFLTAKTLKEDILEGFKIGADDYITKPFRPLVLGAKAKALIRRNKNLVLEGNQMLESGPFSYDTATMRFYKNGEELILSSKESALLLLFMKHPQQVFTKDMIYEHVWGNTIAVDDNAIMVYINRLRGKIEDDRQNPQHILTLRGLGYRFVP